MPLSPREKQILAEIEHELQAQDPALSATFASAPPHPLRVPFWAGQLCVLTLVLGVLVFPLEIVGVGVLTVALILPWLAHTALTAAKRADDRPPRTPRPGLTDHDDRQR